SLLYVLFTFRLLFFLFFFTDTATPEIYTLSLHDALPISQRSGDGLEHAAELDPRDRPGGGRRVRREVRLLSRGCGRRRARAALPDAATLDRDPDRAHDGDHARTRPGHRPRGRRRGRRHHHGPPDAGDGGHRRLPRLHVYSRPHAVDGRRRLQG